MAKSIRSKRRRKMRNVKRQFYGKKEMESLKRIAQRADTELSELITMKSAKDLKNDPVSNPDVNTEDDSKMETDKSVKTYDKRTKLDENGHYPEWMTQRAAKKHKQKIFKQKLGKKGTKLKWQ